MSDIDFRALREETSEATLAPEFAVVEQRAARRRGRGRYAVAAAALGTAGAVALGVSFFVGGGATPPADHTASPPGFSDPAMNPVMTFVDPKHGFTFYFVVKDPQCRSAFRVTDDGGRTWSEVRYSPPAEVPGGYCPRVPEFIDGDTVVVTSPTLAPADRDFISHDAGRTWKPYRPETETVESVPDGITPQQVCLTSKECNQEHYDHLGWYDPDTGDRRVLRNPPHGVDHMGKPFVAEDGSIWTLGYTVAEDGETLLESRIAVSRDRGRTWDVDKSIKNAAMLAGHDGQTAYVVVDGPGMLRTEDGGRTWKEASVPPIEAFDVDGSDEELLMGCIWVGSDNTLFVGDRTDPSKRPVASTDGGRTYHPADVPESLGCPRRFPGGFYAGSSVINDKQGPAYVSEDGLTWRAVPVPNFE